MSNPEGTDRSGRRHYKLIACNVFMREVCRVVSESPNTIDPEFTEVGEHVHPARLRAALQARIDAAAEGGHVHDAVLLAYGLCGNATVGLIARKVPLVIPRAHDCGTLLLGSRAAFRRHFGENPSRPFSSAGYMDRGEYYLRREDAGGLCYGDAYAGLVEQYGEENAEYIWKTMHPPALENADPHPVFIDVPETAHLERAGVFAARAAREGKTAVRLAGDLRLLRRLVSGDWNSDEFLTVQPGRRTVGRYDMDTVIACEPAE